MANGKWENLGCGGNKERKAKLSSHCLGQDLLLLLIYFDLFTIAIYISSSQGKEQQQKKKTGERAEQ